MEWPRFQLVITICYNEPIFVFTFNNHNLLIASLTLRLSQTIDHYAATILVVFLVPIKRNECLFHCTKRNQTLSPSSLALVTLILMGEKQDGRTMIKVKRGVELTYSSRNIDVFSL